MESLFEEIYSSYKNQVYYFVKKYIHGKDDIEDVVQDVFVHLWKYKNSLGANREAIVYKTAKQEIANFYRRNKLLFSEVDESSFVEVQHEEVNEEEHLKNTEMIERLLKLMPEKSQAYFLKNKVDGLSYSQIARENSISKNAVSKHVNKVLQHLKTHMGLFTFLIIYTNFIF